MAATEVGAYSLYSLYLPLYSRIRKKSNIDNEVRSRIYQLIASFPGIHFREVIREYKSDGISKLEFGALTYHMDVLIKDGFCKSSNDGNKKRFYCRGQLMDKSLDDQILDMIVNHYEDNGIGITKKELVEKFDVSEKVIRYNLKKIESNIQKSRDGRLYRYIPLK